MSPRFRPLGAAVALALVLAGGALLAAQDRLTFVGVALDTETRLADKRLCEYLTGKADVRISQEELEYERVVNRLVNWRATDGPFIARMTPYTYVVAELLGADVEPLAAYVSATTGRTVYHSYLVVNRKSFAGPPALAEVQRFLAGRAARGQPARFVYQSQFSASGYFLPSLYFRAHKIFQMAESSESLVAIRADRTAEFGSSKLVALIAEGQADLAAVWDGTKASIEKDEGNTSRLNQRVYFIQLPTALPNDLLVVPEALDPGVKKRLRTAIDTMTADEIKVGDFRTWQTFSSAVDAKLALADLRQAARDRPAPVTVDVQVNAPALGDDASARLGEAARQAVRLSGTEFVVFDADFHRHADVRWTLSPVHDGGVMLTSVLPGLGIDDQQFRLSFLDAEDLTRRIVSIIQTRLHRIRYVWPFSSASVPMVLRDSFAVRSGSPVRVQKVAWLDPERNQFVESDPFDGHVGPSTFYRYEIDAPGLKASGAVLDPLSNVSYRVILLRVPEERRLFQVLTIGLVALFVAAAAAAVLDARRRPRPGPAATIRTA